MTLSRSYRFRMIRRDWRHVKDVDGRLVRSVSRVWASGKSGVEPMRRSVSVGEYGPGRPSDISLSRYSVTVLFESPLSSWLLFVDAHLSEHTCQGDLRESATVIPGQARECERHFDIFATQLSASIISSVLYSTSCCIYLILTYIYQRLTWSASRLMLL